MGGSSKQTVGYWYYWAMHFGWCKGPVDALLELRGGDATMWQGRLTASAQISINKPNLWGGEGDQGQGGVVGAMDVMFGEATQAPNSYLAATFGAQQSGHRGKLTTVFRGGKFGAYSANPKPVSAKVERILTDWQDGVVWYPEKAVIGNTSGAGSGADTGELLLADTSFPANSAGLDPTVAGVTLSSGFVAGDVLVLEHVPGMAYKAWSPWASDSDPAVIDGKPWTNAFYVVGDDGIRQQYWADTAATTADAAEAAATNRFVYLTGSTSYLIGLSDSPITDNRAGLSIRVYKGGIGGAFNSMNPAHILYDSITHADLQGEPVGIINDASFRAAADQLYSEGFGLCTDYDSSAETPLQFQQRICNVIGASLSQSRVDGLYYLDLIRGDYDLASLPIISEDDIIAFSQDASVITETGNMMRVEWTDPQAKEDRTTPPLYSMGNVQSAGRIIPCDPKTYHEIPVESLALRVCSRDLKSSAAPLAKFELTTKGTQRGLRPGMNARLQMPSEGIADLVVVIGSVAHGTATKGQMKIIAVQNVYGLPAAVYVQPQAGLWTPPETAAVASPHQRAFEAPYLELAQTMTAADLSAVPADAGYLLALAIPPTSGQNYAVLSAASGEDYAERGTGEWCPTALVVEAAGYLDTAFTTTDGVLLDRVAIGSWALWENEVVRVDALDANTGALTLGRGCADTVPAIHAAGSRIDLCGEWVSSDKRQYVGGDTVDVKLLTQTAANQLDPSLAAAIAVVFNDRASRPYPPANLQLNGTHYPATISGALTVTWATRDRILQADQVVDTTAASVGPEPDVRYAIQCYDTGGALLAEKLDIGAATAAVTLNYTGQVRMLVYAINDTGSSLQSWDLSFAYTPPAGTSSSTVVAVDWTAPQTIINGGGDP